MDLSDINLVTKDSSTPLKSLHVQSDVECGQILDDLLQNLPLTDEEEKVFTILRQAVDVEEGAVIDFPLETALHAYSLASRYPEYASSIVSCISHLLLSIEISTEKEPTSSDYAAMARMCQILGDLPTFE